MANTPDEQSFDDMMQEMGVKPMHPGARRPVHVPLERPAPQAPPTPPPPTTEELLTSALSRVRELEDELRDSQAAATTAAEQLQQAVERAGRAEKTLVARDEELRKAREELQKSGRRVHASSAELADVKKLLAEHVSIREVMSERGLADERECLAALAGLLLARGGELLAALELSSPEALATLLATRVALVDAAFATDLDKECVIIAVPPHRCEITGGSDVRVAYNQLVESCQRAGIAKITIVGGSPAYRTQLASLAEPHRTKLRLNLVSGTKRRVKQRVEADVRNADLIVLWGGSLLDHSVSGGYTGKSTPSVVIPHRGISGMLARLAEVVDGRG